LQKTKLTAIAASIVALSTIAGCGGSADPGLEGPAGQAVTQTSSARGIETFGLSSDANYYTVDTGAGLVFKIRRTDNGSSTQSAGDIASMIYNGVQYQDQSRGSQLNSGFDFLYTGVSAVNVTATTVGTDYIKVTVTAGNTTHYYMAKKGSANIYMGTYFTSEPDSLNLVRFIARVPIGVLPNGPVPSDIRNNTGAIESGDIFGLADGQTRSKHYSNMRLKDWTNFGATGSGVGMYFVRDNQEGGSGGPFYRSLLNQGTSTNQELTYIVNYGEAQTENFRFGVLNAYTLVFNGGAAPGAVDTSWYSGMGLSGYVAPSGRGGVAGVGINGRDTSIPYTVGFSNANAQYWVGAASGNGYFSTGQVMRPGSYTMTTYKNELAVDTRTVTVTAGATAALNSFTVANDPAAKTALWRIGKWDGSPAEFLNGDKVTTMHPSDVRMSNWVTPDFVVGSSNAATSFPAYQFKDINGTVTIKFNLTAAQITDYTLRVGVTVGTAGGRPRAVVNTWQGPIVNPAAQPSTRTLTVGTYRGNNTIYPVSVPASALVVGENKVTLSVISGTTSTGYLSPGYAIDAVDMVTP
jgi:rhamnogalacturonan endolyase